MKIGDFATQIVCDMKYVGELRSGDSKAPAFLWVCDHCGSTINTPTKVQPACVAAALFKVIGQREVKP
jgi:ribosomal protein L37AE/L43A